MATLLENYNLRYANATLKDKLVSAIAKAGIDIFNEDVGVVNHTNRLIWARRVLEGVGTLSEAEKFMWPAILMGVIDSTTDTTIQTTVSSLVNYFALGT